MDFNSIFGFPSLTLALTLSISMYIVICIAKDGSMDDMTSLDPCVHEGPVFIECLSRSAQTRSMLRGYVTIYSANLNCKISNPTPCTLDDTPLFPSDLSLNSTSITPSLCVSSIPSFFSDEPSTPKWPSTRGHWTGYQRWICRNTGALWYIGASKIKAILSLDWLSTETPVRHTIYLHRCNYIWPLSRNMLLSWRMASWASTSYV